MTDFAKSLVVGFSVGSLSAAASLSGMWWAASKTDKVFYGAWVCGVLGRLAALFGFAWWLYRAAAIPPIPALLALCAAQLLFLILEVLIAYRQGFERTGHKNDGL